MASKLLGGVVTACGKRVSIAARTVTAAVKREAGIDAPEDYRALMAQLGPGTFDGFLTIPPPQHLQSYADLNGPMADLDDDLREAADRLAGRIIFGADIDGRLYCWDVTARKPRIVIVKGFDEKRFSGELAALLRRWLSHPGRLAHWFLPYRRHLLAVAEGMLGAGTDAASLDRWVAALVEKLDARLLARTEDEEHGWRVCEVHLPGADGVVHLQAVDVGDRARCAFRLQLPLEADAAAVADAVVELAGADTGVAWRRLTRRLKPKICGVDV